MNNLTTCLLMSCLFIFSATQAEKMKIKPLASYTGDVVSNIDGGQKRSTQFLSLLGFGAELESASQKSLFHLSGIWIANSNDPSIDLVGSFNQISNIGAAKALRLFRAYWRYRTDSDLNIKIGQIVLDDDFMSLESSSLFLNANLGTLPIQSSNNLAPQYPLGAIGISVGWDTSDSHHLQIALYDGNAGDQFVNKDGFDFDIARDDGFTLLVESNWTSGRFKYQLGAYFDSAKVTDFKRSELVRGNYGLYTALEFQIAKQSQFFVRVGHTPIRNRNVSDLYFDLGFTTKGFGRNDLLGIAFLYSSFSRDFIASSQSALRGHESVIELTYKAQILSSLSFQPDIQYIINPINKNSSNSLILGLRTSLSF